MQEPGSLTHRTAAWPPQCTQPNRETGILLPNNQRQHRTRHAPKDVMPLRICANYCAPCQPLLRAFPGWIRSPPPTSQVYMHRGTSLIKHAFPSRRALGIGLLKGPRGGRFLMSEVPLYSASKHTQGTHKAGILDAVCSLPSYHGHVGCED